MTGAEVADQFVKVTGVAISPLLGKAILGAMAWMRAPSSERPALPWHEQPWFWGVGLALILVVLAGQTLPVISRGFELYKLWESKITAVLALPLVASDIPRSLGVEWPAHRLGILGTMVDSVIPVAHASAMGGPQNGNLLGTLFVVGAALFGGTLIWMTFHTVNVLVLISPFAFSSWILKGLRLVALLAILLALLISPWLAVGVCLVFLVVAAFLAGWAFRLTLFGVIFSTDLITFRFLRHKAPPGGLTAFSGPGIHSLPIRTWGRLVRSADGAFFEYRRFALFPRRVEIRNPYIVGRGLLSPVLLSQPDPASRREVQLVRFPPRYRGQTKMLVHELGASGECPVGVERGLRNAIEWVKEQLGRRRTASTALTTQ